MMKNKKDYELAVRYKLNKKKLEQVNCHRLESLQNNDYFNKANDSNKKTVQEKNESRR